VVWRQRPDGFEFVGVKPKRVAQDSLAEPRIWLSPETRAEVTLPTGAQVLVLGPEPLIAAQRLVLLQGDRQLTLATDGLSPFAVVPTP
jgi:general secretion pathway protein H